ncbi:MAG: hypothetical protein ACWIPH_04620 [Ostreibacterium sp.]
MTPVVAKWNNMEYDIYTKKIYPKNAQGKVIKYDDISAAYQNDVDIADPPLDRHLGKSLQ